MGSIGRIHSYEVGSSVDGPGIRFVLFTQGCPLRCLYCHNPDTRDPLQGKEITVPDIMKEIEKYHSYFDNGQGGLTVSGGEPLLQYEFVTSLFKEAKNKNIHTTLDTSGFGSKHSLESILPFTDLVLLDIKSSIPELYHKVTQVDLTTTLNTIKTLENYGKNFWVRFVLVPGLTDNPKNIEGIAEICSDLQHLKRVEILPFHKLGEYKWKELNIPFSLEKTPIPTNDSIKNAKNIFLSVFKNNNLNIPVY